MAGSGGANKGARQHGDKTAQPWFERNVRKRRNKAKMAKQSKRQNRRK